MTGREGSRELVPPPPGLESQWSLIARSSDNFLRATSGCVSDNTESTYGTSVRQYRLFCVDRGISDIFLRLPPVDFPESPLPFAVMILGSFLVFLVSDNGIQGDSACGYLSGVRHFFSVQLPPVDTTSFDHPSITAARAFVRALDAVKQSKLERRRLPFTHAMLANLRLYVCAWSVPRGRCSIVAAEFGMTLCCRCSEILFSIEDHYLRGKDVVFILLHSSTGCREFISSVVAPSYESSVRSGEWSIVEMFILIRSAKNDQEGEGHPYAFTPSTLSSSCAFCLLSDMWDYAVMAHLPSEDAPFFSYWVGFGSFVLSYHQFKADLKAAALRTIGCSRKIGTQSLRISGATLLNSAHFDKLSIRDYMRCKSMSFLRYVRLSRECVSLANAAASNPSLFTNDDLLLSSFQQLTRK